MLDRTRALHARQERRITVLCAAVADKYGVADFIVARRGRASNALASAGGRSQIGGTRFRRPVATVPMCALLAASAAPNVIKIDIEGAEAMAIAGIGGCLDAAPRIYAEISPENLPAITAILSRAGYRCLDQSGAATMKPNQANYFFVHAEDPVEAAFACYRAGLDG
jgi:FkbM family methyltransferase